MGVALIIGIARGITVITNNGQITDTVLHWAEQALGDVGEAAFAVVMYGRFLPLSSSSRRRRDTSAVVMGGLAIARVPYGKFVWPLLAILAGMVVVLAIGAVL